MSIVKVFDPELITVIPMSPLTPNSLITQAPGNPKPHFLLQIPETGKQTNPMAPKVCLFPRKAPLTLTASFSNLWDCCLYSFLPEFTICTAMF